MTTERKETDGEILARLGTDAVAWAKEFAESVRAAAEREGVDAGDLALDPTPGGMLHAWFCNAIEASRSVGASQLRGEMDRAYAEIRKCIDELDEIVMDDDVTRFVMSPEDAGRWSLAYDRLSAFIDEVAPVGVLDE